MRSQMRRLGLLGGALALLGTGYFLGQTSGEPLAAQQPKGVVPVSGSTPAPAPVATDKRVVAYVHNNVAITREEFGDYLIDLFGQDRVRTYVNRRVIEMAAAKKNIVVTPQEVDAIIEQDCAKLGVDKKQFVENVLKQRYNKTMKEWRDDVIRPRLMMLQLCKDLIKIEDDGLKKIYESIYGEKVVCKVILWPLELERTALGIYDKIRKSDEEFDKMAREQVNSDLAARCGEIAPLGRHSGPGTAKIEEIAFQLKEGQVSEIIKTPAGIMVIKAVKRIPARAEVTFESVRPQLTKELMERMIEEAVPKAFESLYLDAKPLFVYQPRDITRQEIEDQSKRLLKTELTDPSKMK